jgi:hypothetical protein
MQKKVLNKRGLLALVLVLTMVIGSVAVITATTNNAYATVAPPPYQVSIEETGIPAKGNNWTIQITLVTPGTGNTASTGAEYTLYGNGSLYGKANLYNGTYEILQARSSGDYGTGSVHGASGYGYIPEIWNTSADSIFSPDHALDYFTVNGAAVNITATQHSIVPFVAAYALNITESGLPKGTNWEVLLTATSSLSENEFGSEAGAFYTITQNSTLSNISSYNAWDYFLYEHGLVNGSYSYTIPSVDGYMANPSSGTITVNGGNVSFPVKFTQVSTTAPKYPVKFVETGLPSGTNWYVTVSGQQSASTSNTNSLSLANGTYSYTISSIGGHYYASSASGTFTVAGTSNLAKWMNGTLQINVTYYYGYTVTFTESGLSPYVPWSVTVNGTTNSTTGSSTSITFLIKNGTGYTYTVNIAPDWKITANANGKFNVSGPTAPITVTFAEQYFKVTFIETGLPVGTPWVLTVNGVPYTTTNGTLIFSEHNGTLDYIAATEPGYTAKPSSGAVIVGYSDIVTTIVYSPTTVRSGYGNSTGGGFIITGITNFFHTETGMLTIVIVVIVIIGMVVVAETRGHENKGNHIEHKRKMK